jgi:hypothetical protein
MAISTISQNGLNAPLSLTSPALGTPSALVLTNATGLPQAGLATGVAGNGPAMRAYASTDTSATGATVTKIPLNTEVFDAGGCYNNTGSTVTLNGISVPSYSFAPNVAGYYLIQISARTNSQNGEFATLAYVDGSTAVLQASTNQGNTGVGISCGSCIYYLNGTSNYVSMHVYTQNSITIVTSSNGTYMSIALIRSA